MQAISVLIGIMALTSVILLGYHGIRFPYQVKRAGAVEPGTVRRTLLWVIVAAAEMGIAGGLIATFAGDVPAGRELLLRLSIYVPACVGLFVILMVMAFFMQVIMLRAHFERDK